ELLCWRLGVAFRAERGHIAHDALVAERHSDRHSCLRVSGGVGDQAGTAANVTRPARRRRTKYTMSAATPGSTVSCDPVMPNAISGLPRTNSTKKRKMP